MLKESKKEESSKVYCSLCKHFFPKSKGIEYDDDTINIRGELDRAEHDECRRELFTRDTPIRPETYYPEPRELNYNNHCPLYEELFSSPICKYCGELVKMIHTVKFGLLRVCVNPKCRGGYRDQEDNVFYDWAVDTWFLVEEKDKIDNNFKPCGCPIDGLYGCPECMDVQTFNYEEELENDSWLCERCTNELFNGETDEEITIRIINEYCRTPHVLLNTSKTGTVQHLLE